MEFYSLYVHFYFDSFIVNMLLMDVIVKWIIIAYC